MGAASCSAEVQDRRVCRRVPLVCDVWQRAGSCDRAGGSGPYVPGLAGRTLNISDSGALIQLTNLPDDVVSRPNVGQYMELTVALPRETADTFLLEHVKVSGEVVRLIRHGESQPATRFAVRFGEPLPLQLD